MLVHALDPGEDETAIVSVWNNEVRAAYLRPNDSILSILRKTAFDANTLVAIESIASYGMAVGKTTFTTCEWCGRFREAAERNGAKVRKVYRKEVKIHLCGTTKATDANVRQALIDKYGKPPGVTSHLWSALAVADYALHNNPKVTE